MEVKKMNRTAAEAQMKQWLDDRSTLPEIPEEYVKIREELEYIYIESKHGLSESDDKYSYKLDCLFGLSLYEYFNRCDWFTLRCASDDDFWRYLDVVVIPHIVADRWPELNPDHFWRKGIRIWLHSIWRFIHYSWQGSYGGTYDVIFKLDRFGTDELMNFVERPGKHGTYVKVYRKIIYRYSLLPIEKIMQKNKLLKKTNRNDTAFRALMRFNNAKIIVMEPSLYSNGEEGYVISLFNDMGL